MSEIAPLEGVRTVEEVKKARSKWDKWEEDHPTLVDIYWKTYRAFNFVKDVPYKIQCWFQKLFRGYSYRDLWALDTALAPIILKMVRAHRNLPPCGYPEFLDAECTLQVRCLGPDRNVKNEPGYKRWLEVLDKVIFAMDWIANDREGEYLMKYDLDDKPRMEELKKIEARVQEGCELFGKHMQAMWD